MPPLARLLLLAAVLGAAGCALKPAPAPPVLTFAFWALNPREVALTDQLVRDFRQANPTVRLQVLEIPSGYYEKLATMFAGGTPPDVMVLNHGRLRDFARRRVLADLTPYIARHPELLAPALSDGYRPGLTLEWNPTNLLLYDPEALAAAGLSPPGAQSWTWAEFERACRALKPTLQPAQRPASVCLYPYAAMAWLYQAGCDPAVAQAHGLGAVLRDPQSLRAVDFLLGLQRDQLIARLDPAQDHSLENFRAGRVAMTFVTPYSLGMIRHATAADRPWRLALPLRDRRRHTGCLPSSLALSASCASPETALRFMRFYATEGTRRRTAEGFCVPAAKDLLADDVMVQGFGAQAAAVLREATALAAPYPVPLSDAYVTYEQSSGILRRALERLSSGATPPAKALEAAVAELASPAARQR